MKKSLLALAALTAFTGVASAQSSVTLFGIVDLAARSVKNGSAGTVQSLSDSGGATNRIGFRGVEDLGGGLRAGFWLEAGMTPDTGNAGGSNGLAVPAGQSTFFNRRSTVSLMGGFGEIRLGRDYTPTFVSFNTFDIFNAAGVATPHNLRAGNTALGSLANTNTRANNAIAYLLPAMGGLNGQIQVAAGENNPGNKAMGARLGYAGGPVTVSAAFEKTELGANDHKAFNFGAAFNAGFATFGGMYEKNKFGTFDQKLISLNVMVPLGAGALKAQYTKSSGTTALAGWTSMDAKMFGIGYVYNLSKRTSLYTNLANIKNQAGAKFVLPSGPAGIKSGEKSTGYEFGVRHDF